MKEEMRKEFEEWWVAHCVNRHLICSLAKLVNGEYASINARTAWVAWQASREAMEPIKLPVKMKNTEAAECYYYNDAIDECKEAIEQAGYKVAQ